MIGWFWRTLDDVVFFLFRRLHLLPSWVYAWVSIRRDRYFRARQGPKVDVDDDAGFDMGEAEFDAMVAAGVPVEVIGLDAAPVKPRRRLASLYSFRAQPEDIASIREAATRQGMSTSELIRRSALAASQPVGFQCEHMSISTGRGFQSLTSGCGCEMQPVYANMTA